MIVSRRRPSRPALFVLAAGALGAPWACEAAEPAQTVDPVIVSKTRQEVAVPTLHAPVKELAQSAQVIGQEQMRARGVTTLEGALRAVPGVTIAIGEGGVLNGDQFKIRGFDAKDDVFVDGLRDFGVYQRDSFTYREVQVLKGPSGALFGRGAAGGAINIVSKTPNLSPSTELDLYFGGADFRRALADVNLPIGAASAVRVELVSQSGGVVGRDHVHNDRKGLALAWATGLDEEARASVQFVHQQDDGIPDYGIIIVQRPGEITARPASAFGVGVEPSAFLGLMQDRDRNRVDALTVRLSRRLGLGLELTSDTRVGHQSRYFQYSTTDQCAPACAAALFDRDPGTAALAGMGGGGPYDMDAWGLQTVTTLKLEDVWLRLRHLTLLGFDLGRQANDKLYYAYTLPAGVTARNQIPRDLVDPDWTMPAGYAVYRPSPSNICPVAPARACSVTASTVLTSAGASTDISAFLTERVWVSDRMSLIGSARLTHYDARLDLTTVAGPMPTIRSRSTLFSPRASLLWEPNAAASLYMTWGRSSTPQGTSIVGAGTALAAASRHLNPEIATNWEAGGHLSGLRGALVLSGAVFRVDKANAVKTDPATGFTLAQSGERQVVKGLELGLTGRVWSRWSLTAAYSLLEATILSSYLSCSATGLPCAPGQAAGTPRLNPYVIGRPAAFVPRQSASFWTSYAFSEGGDGVSAGGGVIYRDPMTTAYGVTTVGGVTGISRIARIPKTFSVDAYLAWRRGPFRLAVNGVNLTDQVNYGQVFSNRATPTGGRSFILSFGVSL